MAKKAVATFARRKVKKGRSLYKGYQNGEVS